MATANSKFRSVTKSELVERCLAENISYVINSKSSEDIQFIKQLLLNEEGKYTYSISIEEIDKEGKQIAEIKYELADSLSQNID